ncbi:beta-lactamase class C [Amycolatopsis mediterranei S699]|uniref:Beta-lactamase class C n=3 Tax=Amycolatopsis mediterranei TaxID=33910 RepID=A0A0H3D766_AMYMU|nr:serine hydrolase domain-containing protein [Amycolatopsis mediterranei]ADJ45339.1 beta-lactamase class C [Amycolatopsis mediterranei U32]AFO77050.1 beta-lactamase class C [Amycolatopsis mediterranei S699]AGT84178.1 beta-lactamase class C [Amycolatopsis mediterranei RB]KDO08455.1 beta-lactamase [Amycolatopsis mediterranei]KDU89063.1 beta-lactamase [Amycolatopsis mediterranei]
MRINRGAARLLVLAVLSTGVVDVLGTAPGSAASGPGTGMPALDSVLAEQFARSPAVPGIAARVDAPGLRWERAVGKADRATGTPLVAGNTFRIASVTKTFTAAAVLTLVDQRRVNLDAAVARYLSPPYLELLRRGGYDPDLITVRMLLDHTSGLYDYATDDSYRETALTDLHRHWLPTEQIGWAMDHGHPYGAPGALFHYSDTGYVLLARIVESVTGTAQAAAYRRLLRYDRLGLTATWFETLEPAPPTAGARAHQYYVDPAADLDLDAYTADPSFDLYGGGGLVSSVADLTRFYRALLDGRVLSRAALRTMLTLVPAADGDGAGMGIFPRRIEGMTCWWHNGFWGSAVLYCPQRRLAVAVTVNAFTADRTTPTALADAVALATAASKSAPGPVKR